MLATPKNTMIESSFSYKRQIYCAVCKKLVDRDSPCIRKDISHKEGVVTQLQKGGVLVYERQI